MTTPDPIGPPENHTGNTGRLWYAANAPLADSDSRFHAATIAEVDAKIKEEGYAVGLAVLEQVEKAYVRYLNGDNELAEAQIASLLDALRQHGGTESG